MNKINWQEYEDGSMTPEMRKTADELLKTDPKAQEELDGLRSFRKSIRKACLTEPVPEHKLRKILRSIVSPTGSKSGSRRLLLPLGAAAAMAAVAWFAFGPSITTDPNVERTLMVSNSTEAAAFAAEGAGFAVPPITLAGLNATLTGTHCKDGFACFDFLVDGALYHVTMQTSPASTDPGTMKRHEGQDFLICPKGVRWEDDSVNFMVMGPDEETRWKIAEAAAREASIV
jgi:hypothetical protein